MDYKKAGVDLRFADKIPDIINALKKKHKSKDRTELGGFGGFYYLECTGLKNQILVAGTDGVGTKTLLATKFNKYNGLGIDLVAMSVNDIATTGARPLFFLDYLGFSRLNKEYFSKLISGIITGCKQANCLLLGGETAEMPDVYKPGDFDLVGFAVGIVDKKNLITGKNIKPGDKIIGIASTGPHSNGFTLIRKVYEKHPEALKKNLDTLLKPTRIYTGLIEKLINKFEIKGIAHITGGGLVGNIPRIIPKNLEMHLDYGNWKVPAIFREIQDLGEIPDKEMYRVFNMGIGLALVVSDKIVEKLLSYLKKSDEKAFKIGSITRREK